MTFVPADTCTRRWSVAGHLHADRDVVRLTELPVIRLTGWAVMCEVQVKTRRREGDALPSGEE